MNKKLFLYSFFIVLVVVSFSGCANILPSESQIVKTKWHSYDDTMVTFNNIAVGQTTAMQLKNLGLDPRETPNIKILTFLDIKKQFIASSLESADYVPKSVHDCIESMDACHGLELNIVKNHTKRHGNAFLDIFNFRRQTEQIGWEFNGLVILKHDVVVYKLASGKPIIVTEKDQKNPLGPIQSLDGMLFLNMGKK